MDVSKAFFFLVAVFIASVVSSPLSSVKRFYEGKSNHCSNHTFLQTDLASRLVGFRICLEFNGVLSARLVDPFSNSSGYEILNRQWNTRIPKVYPVAYFLPLTSGDVQFAVKCGVRVGIHLIPNSGGHSYESISWGDNSTIVVDFREMLKVEVVVGRVGNDVIAKIQPGALVGPINGQLWQIMGGLGIPMGNCLTVGIGGHAIGGGIGFFSSLYGLTIDRVIEFEMVDAEGELVVANEEGHNSDLFWALKGVAAGYIGIVTSFKFRTFKAQDLKISAIQVVYPIKDFVKVGTAFQNWMRWTRENDPTIFSMATVTNDDWTSLYPSTAKGPVGGIIVTTLHIYDPQLNPCSNATFLSKVDEMFPPGYRFKAENFLSYIEFVYFSGYAPVRLNVTVADYPNQGPSSTAEPYLIQKVVEIGRLDAPILDEAFEFKWRNEAQTRPSMTNPIAFSASPNDIILRKLMALKKEGAVERYFLAKSLFVKRQLKGDELQNLEQILQRIPNNRCWLLISSEMGAVHDIAYNATAYVHRDAWINFSVHIEAVESDGLEEARDWFNEFWTTMQSFDGGETYQNYPDLSMTNFLERYYGANLERLVAIKGAWDPRNYFRNPISLPISMN